MKLITKKTDYNNPQVREYGEAFQRGLKALNDEQYKLLIKSIKNTNIQDQEVKQRIIEKSSNPFSKIQEILRKFVSNY